MLVASTLGVSRPGCGVKARMAVASILGLKSWNLGLRLVGFEVHGTRRYGVPQLSLRRHFLECKKQDCLSMVDINDLTLHCL